MYPSIQLHYQSYLKVQVGQTPQYIITCSYSQVHNQKCYSTPPQYIIISTLAPLITLIKMEKKYPQYILNFSSTGVYHHLLEWSIAVEIQITQKVYPG